MQFKKLKKKNRKNKTINDYAKLIQSIRKEYQRLALENELLKKYEKIEDKQFITDLIENNKKQIEFFEGRKKKKT